MQRLTNSPIPIPAFSVVSAAFSDTGNKVRTTPAQTLVVSECASVRLHALTVTEYGVNDVRAGLNSKF